MGFLKLEMVVLHMNYRELFDSSVFSETEGRDVHCTSLCALYRIPVLSAGVTGIFALGTEKPLRKSVPEHPFCWWKQPSSCSF